jgi:hypothetical protein
MAPADHELIAELLTASIEAPPERVWQNLKTSLRPEKKKSWLHGLLVTFAACAVLLFWVLRPDTRVVPPEQAVPQNRGEDLALLDRAEALRKSYGASLEQLEGQARLRLADQSIALRLVYERELARLNESIRSIDGLLIQYPQEPTLHRAMQRAFDAKHLVVRRILTQTQEPPAG